MEQELGKRHRHHPFRTGLSEDSHNLTTHIELIASFCQHSIFLNIMPILWVIGGGGGASLKRFAEGDSMFTTDKGGYESNLILSLQ